MSAPDWKNGSLRMGGRGWTPDLVRKFPAPEGEEKRRVTVRFVSWAGTAPGAVHTHVTLEPEDNPVWFEDTWATLWDDPERNAHEALLRKDTFLREDRAVRWAVRQLERHFPTSAWQHVWPDYAEDEGEDPSPFDPKKVTADVEEDCAVEPCTVCDHAQGEHTPEMRQRCREAALDVDAASFGAPARPLRVLVNGGDVEGVVGQEVLVIRTMHRSHIQQLDGVRAVIAESGGATSFLAQAARERNITVVLVEGALDLLPKGCSVRIDLAREEVS